MDNTNNSRRGFLKKIAAAAPVAAAAVAAPKAVAKSVVEAPKSQGLRSTAHTRKYFEKARF